MLDNLHVVLNIEVETYQRNLLNLYVEKGVEITNISIDDVCSFDDELCELIQLTKEDLDEICYEKNKITLIEYSSKYHQGYKMTFNNDKGFTVREMFDNIVQFEKKARPLSKWFGGIDAHHIYFEGLSVCEDSDEYTYTLNWGS